MFQTNSNICGDELRDEMSPSISSLHKCGTVLIVRRSIDHPIWIQTHITCINFTASCCFPSAIFYPGSSSQEPHSWAHSLLCIIVFTQHTLYIFRAPCPGQCSVCSTDPACPKQLVSNFNILSFVVKWRERRTRQSVIKNLKRRHFILIM